MAEGWRGKKVGRQFLKTAEKLATPIDCSFHAQFLRRVRRNVVTFYPQQNFFQNGSPSSPALPLFINKVYYTLLILSRHFNGLHGVFPGNVVPIDLLMCGGRKPSVCKTRNLPEAQSPRVACVGLKHCPTPARLARAHLGCFSAQRLEKLLSSSLPQNSKNTDFKTHTHTHKYFY